MKKIIFLLLLIGSQSQALTVDEEFCENVSNLTPIMQSLQMSQWPVLGAPGVSMGVISNTSPIIDMCNYIKQLRNSMNSGLSLDTLKTANQITNAGFENSLNLASDLNDLNRSSVDFKDAMLGNSNPAEKWAQARRLSASIGSSVVNGGKVYNDIQSSKRAEKEREEIDKLSQIALDQAKLNDALACPKPGEKPSTSKPSDQAVLEYNNAIKGMSRAKGVIDKIEARLLLMGKMMSTDAGMYDNFKTSVVQAKTYGIFIAANLVTNSKTIKVKDGTINSTTKKANYKNKTIYSYYYTYARAEYNTDGSKFLSQLESQSTFWYNYIGTFYHKYDKMGGFIKSDSFKQAAGDTLSMFKGSSPLLEKAKREFSSVNPMCMPSFSKRPDLIPEDPDSGSMSAAVVSEKKISDNVARCEEDVARFKYSEGVVKGFYGEVVASYLEALRNEAGFKILVWGYESKYNGIHRMVYETPVQKVGGEGVVSAEKATAWGCQSSENIKPIEFQQMAVKNQQLTNKYLGMVAEKMVAQTNQYYEKKEEERLGKDAYDAQKKQRDADFERERMYRALTPRPGPIN